MTIKPLFLGARALMALEQANLPVRPISSGNWVVSGTIAILAASGQITLGYDTPYTWSDAGVAQWRFFEVQRGTSIVLSLQSRAYIASTNKYYAINSSAALIPPSPLANTPAWLLGSAFSLSAATCDAASVETTLAPRTVHPRIMWWDPTGPALPTLTRFEEDVVYDLFTEATLNTGGTYPAWVTISAATQLTPNSLSVVKYAANGTISKGHFAWALFAEKTPPATAFGAAPLIFYYIVVLTVGIATTAADITNIAPNAAGVVGLVTIGPIIIPNESGTQNTGASIASAFIPGLAPLGKVTLPNGADSVNTGVLVIVPTGVTGAWSSSAFTSLSTPGEVLMTRQEQQAIGAAQRVAT